VRLTCIFTWRFSYSQGIAHYTTQPDPPIQQSVVRKKTAPPDLPLDWSFPENEKWRQRIYDLLLHFMYRNEKRPLARYGDWATKLQFVRVYKRNSGQFFFLATIRLFFSADGSGRAMDIAGLELYRPIKFPVYSPLHN